jgi:hypothetical protein
MPSHLLQETPLALIATITKTVTSITDQLTGDRSAAPLLVAKACQYALGLCQIQSDCLYGSAAWIEITEAHSPLWTGCWDSNVHFWVQTEFQETVDLNVSVATRQKFDPTSQIKTIISPPMVWSKILPKIYCYDPHGIAEFGSLSESELTMLNTTFERIQKSLSTDITKEPVADDFPNEAILCPNQKVLDDSKGSFRTLDRAVGIHGLPDLPGPFRTNA